MFEILQKDDIAPGLVLLRIKAPEVAKKTKPGQFVMVRADEVGERIPLSIADWDDSSITVIIQDVGVTTRKLSALVKGDIILNLAGPLGKPSKIENYGTVAVVSGCFGTGPGFAMARELKSAGNKVVYVIEARNRDWIFWADKIEGVSDKLIVTCNDGSATECNAKGPLEKILASEMIDRVYAIGCTFMMMEISRITQPFGIQTRVSLMPLMVDGTGMCGACRCSVDDKVVFGCVDGPEFDGHKVDWSQLIERMRGFLDSETEALDLWERENWHKAVDAKAKGKAIA